MSISHEIKLIKSLNEIDTNQWSQVIQTDYPFIQYEFLKAMEDSGATCAKTGWQPLHLTIWQDENLVGLMPLYLKDHSYGEYVFDFQWADAYFRSGLNYYPKLLSAIPYSPVSGKRIYLAESCVSHEQEIINQIVKSIEKIAEEKSLSSCHLLFPLVEESNKLQESGWVKRLGVQYHWFNDEYQDFDEFLAACKLKYRKNIKRERKSVDSQGIDIEVLQGKEITETIWQEFYMFYQLTYMKRSGHGGYLNQDFFQQIGNRMKDSIVMIVAKSDDEIVAASLFFRDSNNLYGRYWGCIREYDFLHFELCYYQGIEYCINNGLKKFDAGAQGEHKIQRGFRPVQTFSNHWITHPDFSSAIGRFINDEKSLIKADIKRLEKKLPFKREQ
ncbi:MAG: GNAT family N-acetyltransferase [Gammaproteobacteria bacterium]|nr:GNAT family N-acetyltransferase [Gammaproteobacteria bacterium]